jgi:hypothetical protein
MLTRWPVYAVDTDRRRTTDVSVSAGNLELQTVRKAEPFRRCGEARVSFARETLTISS